MGNEGFLSIHDNASLLKTNLKSASVFQEWASRPCGSG